MTKRAYISVSDKENVVKFAKQLSEEGCEIFSTGGTFNLLKENKIKVHEVSELTRYPEMLSGKVKSLHPEVFAGILADITNKAEAREIELNALKVFDMVVVNLYPFEQVAKHTDNIDELLKNIDIGGVALLRAAAKNYKNVTVVCDKSDYDVAINADETTRQKLALKAFLLTSDYDKLINSKLSEVFGEEEVKHYSFTKKQDLRYGENPHQKAGLFNCGQNVDFEVLWGKELSYNNILDMTAAVNITSEFYDVPAVAIVKHLSPCGVALGKDISDALQKALDCDPVSAFGGIIALTKSVDIEVAKIISSMFVEVVIAPEYDEKALELMKAKKNIRLVKLNTPLKEYKHYQTEEIKLTPFGALAQDADNKELDKDNFNVATKKKPTTEQIEDAIFAWKIAKHAKSNAIVIVKDFKTVAIGQGQTSRISAMEWALDYACDETKDAVIASDGFFPAIDNIQSAAQARISLIIQPGGSIKDKEVIEAADKYNISMITTGIRHFKH